MYKLGEHFNILTVRRADDGSLWSCLIFPLTTSEDEAVARFTLIDGHGGTEYDFYYEEAIMMEKLKELDVVSWPKGNVKVATIISWHDDSDICTIEWGPNEYDRHIDEVKKDELVFFDDKEDGENS